MSHAGTSLSLLPQVLPLLLFSSLAALLLFPPSANTAQKKTDHPVRLFTLSSTVSLLPWIVCGLKDRITPQECPLVFQSLHHLHLSTLQPFSLPAKDCMFGESPYHDASRNVSQRGFSSRRGPLKISTLSVFSTSS